MNDIPALLNDDERRKLADLRADAATAQARKYGVQAVVYATGGHRYRVAMLRIIVAMENAGYRIVMPMSDEP